MSADTPNPGDSDTPSPADLDQSVDRLLEEVDSLTEEVLHQASSPESAPPQQDPAQEPVADDAELSTAAPLIQDGDRTGIEDVVADVELELDRAHEQLEQIVAQDPAPQPARSEGDDDASKTIGAEPPASQLGTGAPAIGTVDALRADTMEDPEPAAAAGAVAGGSNPAETEAADATDQLDALLAEASALAGEVGSEPASPPAGDTESLSEMESMVAEGDPASSAPLETEIEVDLPSTQAAQPAADSSAAAPPADDADCELLAEMEQLMEDAETLSTDVLETSATSAVLPTDEVATPPLSTGAGAEVDGLVEQVDAELDRLGELVDDLDTIPQPMVSADDVPLAAEPADESSAVDVASEIASTPETVDVSSSSTSEKKLDDELDALLAPPPPEAESAQQTTTAAAQVDGPSAGPVDLAQFDTVPIWGVLRMRMRRRLDAWGGHAGKFSYDKIIEGLELVDRPFARMSHRTKELIGYCALGTLGMSLVAVFVAFAF